MTPPVDSDVDFTLTVTATATEAANGDASVRTDTIDVDVTAVADQPTLTVPSTITVDEDTNSAVFTISSTLIDTDGSEALTLEISGVPLGVTLTDGANTFTATAGNTTLDVTHWTLSNLSVTPPADSDADFSLTVTATATEAANSDSSTRVDTIDFEVVAVADQPTLTVPSTITVDEDTQSARVYHHFGADRHGHQRNADTGDQRRSTGSHTDGRHQHVHLDRQRQCRRCNGLDARKSLGDTRCR